MIYNVTADAAEKVARTIGHCDFRSAISRYATSENCPWIVTVGESLWQRHLVIKAVENGGEDARLALLTPDQGLMSVKDLNTSSVQRELTLKELIAGSYTGVKKILTSFG